MMLERFFEKFDTFADAPGAVAKLRELVLEMAVRGGLSERLLSDQKDEAWLKVSGKHDPHFTSNEFDPPPFEIPEAWRWVCLNTLGQTRVRNNADDSTRVSFVPMALIPAGYGHLVQQDERTWSEVKKAFTHFADGDVIMAKITPCFENGKSAVMRCLTNGIGAGTTELHVFRRSTDAVLPEFVLIYLKTRGFISRGESRMTGSAGQKRVPRDHFAFSPFPLPPPAEQKRIVSKVDELMALCDRLEAQQQERESRHAALARASLARFADAPTPENLEYLFHPAYAIAPGELRKAVLTLAVRGKLVRQETGYGSTRMVSMEELVGRRNMKNGLSLVPAEGESSYVSLPLSAMRGSTIDCSVGKPVDLTSTRAAPYLVKPHEVYIIRGNGSKERVGIAGIVRTCPSNVLFPDLFIHIPLPLEKIAGEYFLIAWNSPVTREMLESLATTTSGIWKVNQGHISECVIPVPPLVEQRLIVTKVNELLVLVDQLEAQLVASRTTATGLLDALVTELTVQA